MYVYYIRAMYIVCTYRCNSFTSFVLFFSPLTMWLSISKPSKYFLKTCKTCNMTCLFWKMANQKLHSKIYFHKYEKRLNVYKDTIYLTDVTDVKSTVTEVHIVVVCCWLFRRSRRTNNRRFESRIESYSLYVYTYVNN